MNMQMWSVNIYIFISICIFYPLTSDPWAKLISHNARLIHPRLIISSYHRTLVCVAVCPWPLVVRFRVCVSPDEFLVGSVVVCSGQGIQRCVCVTQWASGWFCCSKRWSAPPAGSSGERGAQWPPSGASASAETQTDTTSYPARPPAAPSSFREAAPPITGRCSGAARTTTAKSVIFPNSPNFSISSKRMIMQERVWNCDCVAPSKH